MDIVRPLVRHVTAPLFSRRDGFSFARQQRELEASQWLPRAELEELQSSRLRTLVEFAYRHNAFYRQRMRAAGVVPSDVRGVPDLAGLPVLTKDDIRAAGPALFSDGFSPANTRHTRTGGSTGVPLHVYVDTEAMNWKYAATWRHNGWAGWRPGDKVAAVWGDTAKARDWKKWLRFWFQNRTIFVDTLKFSAERLREFHAEIVKFRPTVIMGHAHSVYQFAAFCRDQGLSMPPLSGIVTTAMTLLEAERRVIEEAFRSRVFDRYGCEELSIIASESDAHSGLHVFSEGLVLEYLPTDAAGESELVITDLFNRAMPMIRYAIGDVACSAVGSCPSGRGLERLARVSGRTADFLYRPDGTPVFGISLLDTYIIHIPGIRQAQMVQNELRRIDVRVVPGAGFGPATEQAIQAVVSGEFGPDVRAAVSVVDRLEQTERGKYRFSICNIEPPVAPGPR
jgi:phenylacetate-CoA ligase